jgi:DNA polymerase III delta prime subunit
VLDEVERLTIGAQQSLRSPMGLKRCMFFLTTNYLSKVDQGIVNRCHLIEMNQITTSSAYVPLGQSILRNMGVANDLVNVTTLNDMATNSRGSLCDFSNDVVIEGIKNGGSLIRTNAVVQHDISNPH